MQTHRLVTVRKTFVTAAFFLAAITASGSFAADAPAQPNADNTAAKKPGTAKPVIGDILEGTNIRKKPGAGARPAKPNSNQGKGQRRIESPRDISSGQLTGK